LKEFSPQVKLYLEMTLKAHENACIPSTAAEPEEPICSSKI